MEAKKTVLIVEDQKINREILKGILHQDFLVLEAEDGDQVAPLLEEHKEIAAILLDIMMPRKDGWTVLKELALTPFKTIPVIAVTAENDEAAEQRILDLGAWDFVSKPYQPMTLVTRLKNAIVRNEYYQIGLKAAKK